MSGPVGVEKFSTGFIGTFVGVSAEVIPLGLEEIGRKAAVAVAVVI
jgi:hypothetical protein